EKTAKANRKAVREAARLAKLAHEEGEDEVSSQHTSDDETSTMGDAHQQPPPPPPERTLGDYGQNNGRNANLGFQPVNPVSF
ncbi:hypothetical protein A2U01_0091309, partial [Trifolium medium]|nr:hypothetical protein [Trifolium medium]